MFVSNLFKSAYQIDLRRVIRTSNTNIERTNAHDYECIGIVAYYMQYLLNIDILYRLNYIYVNIKLIEALYLNEDVFL